MKISGMKVHRILKFWFRLWPIGAPWTRLVLTKRQRGGRSSKALMPIDWAKNRKCNRIREWKLKNQTTKLWYKASGHHWRRALFSKKSWASKIRSVSLKVLTKFAFSRVAAHRRMAFVVSKKQQFKVVQMNRNDFKFSVNFPLQSFELEISSRSISFQIGGRSIFNADSLIIRILYELSRFHLISRSVRRTLTSTARKWSSLPNFNRFIAFMNCISFYIHSMHSLYKFNACNSLILAKKKKIWILGTVWFLENACISKTFWLAKMLSHPPGCFGWIRSSSGAYRTLSVLSTDDSRLDSSAFRHRS